MKNESLVTQVIVLAAVTLLLVPTGLSETVKTPEMIQAVKDAKEPSVVVAAYSRALFVYRKHPALHEAYIRRMIDLGRIDMAIHQAKLLADMDPKNPLGWGVLSFDAAARGDISKSLDLMDKALASDRQDPFVLNMGGQLLAWYDVGPVDPQVKSRIRKRVDLIRKANKGKEAFDEGYTNARAGYEAEALARDDEQGEQARPDPLFEDRPDQAPADDQAIQAVSVQNYYYVTSGTTVYDLPYLSLYGAYPYYGYWSSVGYYPYYYLYRGYPYFRGHRSGGHHRRGRRGPGHHDRGGRRSNIGLSYSRADGRSRAQLSVGLGSGGTRVSGGVSIRSSQHERRGTSERRTTVRRTTERRPTRKVQNYTGPPASSRRRGTRESSDKRWVGPPASSRRRGTQESTGQNRLTAPRPSYGRELRRSTRSGSVGRGRSPAQTVRTRSTTARPARPRTSRTRAQGPSPTRRTAPPSRSISPQRSIGRSLSRGGPRGGAARGMGRRVR